MRIGKTRERQTVCKKASGYTERKIEMQKMLHQFSTQEYR